MPDLQLADEVKDIARILIAKYHPHLADARILYVFTDQTRRRCDRVKLGTAAKMNSLQRFLASSMESVESGPDYILMFDIKIWPSLDEKQQRSLTDHELEHCKIFVKAGMRWLRLPADQDKDDYAAWKYGLIDHDISEFVAIVERHGIWRTDGVEQEFANAVRQMPLPGLAINVPSRN